MVLAKIRSQIIFLVVGAYLILNQGFMLLRVPPGGSFGVPFGEMLVILFVLTFVFDLKRLPSFANIVPLVPLILWWAVSYVNLVIGVEKHGAWALRDATHIIDSSFLWIGYVAAASPGFFERFSNWLRFILNLGVFYSLLFPFRETLQAYSPKIWAPGGYSTPVFFDFQIGGIVTLTAAMRWLVDRASLFRIPVIVLVGAVVVYTAAVFQARTVYLQILTLFLIMMVVQPRSAIQLSFSMLLGLAGLVLLLMSGVEITGRLQEKVSLEFFTQHFSAIWGAEGEIATVRGAAGGIGQRLEWWLKIWNDVTENLSTLFFGLGYGMPLTDFIFTNGAIVREPHNSVVSIFARTGFIGLLTFLSLHFFLLQIWLRVFRQCQSLGNTIWRNNLLIMGVFMLMVWVSSIGEDAFEKPYACIPVYFFWGIIIRMEYELRVAKSVQPGRQTTLSPNELDEGDISRGGAATAPQGAA